ncbi:MAG: chorismate lyase [Burkholderiales bacterium]|nr:chorismate lyase [Burkholderiales bacterium]
MRDNLASLSQRPAVWRPAAASWHAHVNALQVAPTMQDWLTNRASLTARLVARCGQFRVQKLEQSTALCLADEYAAIALPRRSKVHQREVLLRCDGEAMVYAHTVVSLQASATQWPLFSTLGERSLGSTLFNDPQVVRGALSYARLRASHPLLRRVRAVYPLAPSCLSLPARRSLFWRKGSCLLVTELFLPGILQLGASGV